MGRPPSCHCHCGPSISDSISDSISISQSQSGSAGSASFEPADCDCFDQYPLRFEFDLSSISSASFIVCNIITGVDIGPDFLPYYAGQHVIPVTYVPVDCFLLGRLVFCQLSGYVGLCLGRTFTGWVDLLIEKGLDGRCQAVMNFRASTVPNNPIFTGCAATGPGAMYRKILPLGQKFDLTQPLELPLDTTIFGTCVFDWPPSITLTPV